MSVAVPDLRISAVRAADVTRVIALAREIWYLHYPGIITVAQIDYMLAQRYGEDLVRAQIGGGDICWDKIEVDDVLAGFVSVEYDSHAGTAKLDKIYVHPRFQRRGLGSALLNHVERRSAQRDCVRVWLQVNKNNAASIAVYRRNGYRIAESARFDIGLGFVMDDYILEKSLAAKVSQKKDEGQGVRVE